MVSERRGANPPMVRSDFEFGVRDGLPYIMFPMPNGREVEYTFRPIYSSMERCVIFDLRVVNKRGYGFGGVIPFYPEGNLDRKFLSSVMKNGRLILIDMADHRRQLVVKLSKRQIEQLRFFTDLLDF